MPARESMVQSHGTAPTYRIGRETLYLSNFCLCDPRTNEVRIWSDKLIAALRAAGYEDDAYRLEPLIPERWTSNAKMNEWARTKDNEAA